MWNYGNLFKYIADIGHECLKYSQKRSEKIRKDHRIDGEQTKVRSKLSEILGGCGIIEIRLSRTDS